MILQSYLLLREVLILSRLRARFSRINLEISFCLLVDLALVMSLTLFIKSDQFCLA